MSVSVTKSGPYFSSGSISFSQLRNTFTDDQPGFGRKISASQLRRNTDVTLENPIVPDSTENEQISTGFNLSLSQFRNSIKRYLATQTGTDNNQSYPGEPGFRMGRLDTNGRGIDWSGGGYNGRDGQGGGITGNLAKNVQKGVLITGVCGSLQPGQPAAQLSPSPRVHNVRIDVSGSILGYGGRGGGTSGAPDPSGEDGAIGLNLGNIGFNNRVIVGSGARIYGGGGGGERGRRGDNGQDGRCIFTTRTQGCGSKPGCPSGYVETGTWNGGCCENVSYCCAPFNCGCTRCTKSLQGRDCKLEYIVYGGIGGEGGVGGDGKGYNNLGGPSPGSDGQQGQPPQGTGSVRSNLSYSWSENDTNARLTVTGTGTARFRIRIKTNDNPSDAGTSYERITLHDGNSASDPVLISHNFPGDGVSDSKYSFVASPKTYLLRVLNNARNVQVIRDGGLISGVQHVKLRDFDGSDENAAVWVADIEQFSTSSTKDTCGATSGKPGERGGNGGDWGERGQGTNNSGNGGSGGKAIAADSPGYNIYGTINSNTIRGSIY